jgi:hypothetical protein
LWRAHSCARKLSKQPSAGIVKIDDASTISDATKDHGSISTESHLVILKERVKYHDIMQFEYEITADDYAAAMQLYHKMTSTSKRLPGGTVWILSGIFLLLVAWNERVPAFSHVLLLFIGVWWIYAGIMMFFPARHYRRFYPPTGLAGEKFIADATDEGLSVKGDAESWQLKWSAVRSKGENERILILAARAGTIFMFGKQYLSGDEQKELRRLTGLSARELPCDLTSNILVRKSR